MKNQTHMDHHMGRQMQILNPEGLQFCTSENKQIKPTWTTTWQDSSTNQTQMGNNDAQAIANIQTHMDNHINRLMQHPNPNGPQQCTGKRKKRTYLHRQQHGKTHPTIEPRWTTPMHRQTHNKKKPHRQQHGQTIAKKKNRLDTAMPR